MINISGVSRTFTGRSGTVEALRDIYLEVASAVIDYFARSA